MLKIDVSAVPVRVGSGYRARRARPSVTSAFARIASAALLTAVATDAQLATAWGPLATSATGAAIESLGPPALLARADGAWVLYSPTLSVDCSPPRGCYAKTQRIHYDFSCAGRYAVTTERISMDLNGNIVKHERLEFAGLTPSYDAGAVLLLDTFCPLPDRGDR